jgi:hypothetical protein
VAYKDGNQKLNGLVTSNAGKKLPGVLILPAWKGIDNEAKNAAIELEKARLYCVCGRHLWRRKHSSDNAAAAKSQDNTSRITKLISKGFLLLWKN